MIQRLWSFIKRHRRKVLGSAFFIGGSCIAWRYLKPRLTDYLLQRLVKQMNEGNVSENALKFEDPKEVETNKRARFVHSQQVSHGHTKKTMDTLEKKLKTCFEVERRTEELQEKGGSMSR